MRVLRSPPPRCWVGADPSGLQEGGSPYFRFLCFPKVGGVCLRPAAVREAQEEISSVKKLNTTLSVFSAAAPLSSGG